MTYQDFKTQCEEYLPTVGAKNIQPEAILNLSGIVYKCRFTIGDDFFVLTCNRFGIMRLRKNEDLVAEIGHVYIKNCLDRYFESEANKDA